MNKDYNKYLFPSFLFNPSIAYFTIFISLFYDGRGRPVS